MLQTPNRDKDQMVITLSGQQVWPPGHVNGDTGYPTLEDIGVGLGRAPRFAGQTYHWYPVLSHTKTVAELVPKESKPYALLHDAPESVMGDTPTPFKCEQAKEWEEHLLIRLTKANGLIWPWPEEIDHDVKVADAVALAAEAEILGFYKPSWFLDHYFPTYLEEPEVQRVIEKAKEQTLRQLLSARDFLVAGYAANHYRCLFELSLDGALT